MTPSILPGIQGLLRRLPPAGESVLVFAIFFGPLLVTNVLWLLTPRTEWVVEVSNERVVSLILQELTCLALAAFVLWSRGWRLADFNVGPTWRGTAAGIVLYLLNAVLYPAAWSLALVLTGGRNPFEAARFDIGVSLGLAVIVSVVNPLFEEFAVVGYLFKTLPERYGLLAIFLSTGIRLLYHAYQGPIAMIALLPLGLLFGFTYYRFRQLWPLLLAHGMLDLVALT